MQALGRSLHLPGCALCLTTAVLLVEFHPGSVLGEGSLVSMSAATGQRVPVSVGH